MKTPPNCQARASLLVALALVAACADTMFVRVDGLVTRGPVQPVCVPDLPCDAPFSAGFTVYSGGRMVLHFRSDANGRFTIFLAPGEYEFVPDGDAPLLDPSGQTKTVSVPTADSFGVTLTFDTGIR